jgi:hypothetical protein
MNLLDLLTQSDQTDLERRFVEFHGKNPEVYVQLVRLARILKARGHKRIGIAMLFEQLRWQYALKTTDLSGFKLNNNYRAYYARLIMEKNLDLVGFFETREVK